MTLLSVIIGLFPALIVASLLATLIWFGLDPSWVQPCLALFVLYLLPPLCFRVHEALFPKTKDLTDLSMKKYSPWWGGHQIQLLYLAVPSLEGLLRMVPGLYSAWLRLWGARIGKGVYWTPQIEITDRDLLEIGDHVVFGHKVAFYSHVVKPKGKRLLLYVRPIKIGHRVFVGAGTRIGPGVEVDDEVQLPILQDLYVNLKVSRDYRPMESPRGGVT